MLRTSPAKQSSWMAATPFDDRSWRGQCHAFHHERPSGPAAVAGDREGRDATRELLPDEPMTATASTHESDLLMLTANSAQEAVRAALPPQHDGAWGRFDSNVAVHSFSSTLSPAA